MDQHSRPLSLYRRYVHLSTLHNLKPLLYISHSNMLSIRFICILIILYIKTNSVVSNQDFYKILSLLGSDQNLSLFSQKGLSMYRCVRWPPEEHTKQTLSFPVPAEALPSSPALSARTGLPSNTAYPGMLSRLSLFLNSSLVLRRLRSLSLRHS